MSKGNDKTHLKKIEITERNITRVEEALTKNRTYLSRWQCRLEKFNSQLQTPSTDLECKRDEISSNIEKFTQAIAEQETRLTQLQKRLDKHYRKFIVEQYAGLLLEHCIGMMVEHYNKFLLYQNATATTQTHYSLTPNRFAYFPTSQPTCITAPPSYDPTIPTPKNA